MMTEKQKSEIIRMRVSGVTMSKIAEILNISTNTVKTFCRRNKVTVSSNNMEYKENCCLQCGIDIRQIEHIKTIKFCCPECRVKWWNSHPELVNRKAVYSFICKYCGKPFTAYGNKNRKYCSHKCYINFRFNEGVEKR